MFSVTLSEQQQKDLARNLVSFLSRYKYIIDAYIIEFFSENLWETLPEKWQNALQDLSSPQVADLLLERKPKDRVYPSVWPLSLLALRATAHTLAFPRMYPAHQSKNTVKPDEFKSNSSQSALLGHIFRKHVKPKKQHEIRKLGVMVKQLCDQTQCSNVVDVGSGQGHLTRFLSFGLGLDVIAVEADPNLVSMASKFDKQLLLTLAKECRKTGIAHKTLDPLPRHIVCWVNPRDTWKSFLQQLLKRETNSESYPGHCKKRQQVLMPSDKECELETDLICRSQHCMCTRECSSVAYDDENPAESILKQHEQEINDCVSQSLTAEHCLHNGLECSTSIFSETSSTLKELVCSDFVLTGLHACGDLSATLLRHFVNCPHVRGITSVACCYMKITTEENPTPPGVIHPSLFDNTNDHVASSSEYGYPMSEWVKRLHGHELSYKAREGACHAFEDYLHRLRDESLLLKSHCYRAALECIIKANRPQLRRAGIQTIKKAHMLPFSEYARLGLTRVGFPAELTFDPVSVQGLLDQQGRVVVYFSLALLLAPVVETLILLDRMLYLQERGFHSQLIPLFNPALSPRNLVLVAVKPKEDGEQVIQ